MRTAIVIICSLAAGAVLASAVNAAQPWRVFAAGEKTNAYYSYASASADVTAPKALAVRNTGNVTAELEWFFSCQGNTVTAKPGQVVTVQVSAAKSCTVQGAITGEGGGKVRVELLRR